MDAPRSPALLRSTRRGGLDVATAASAPRRCLAVRQRARREARPGPAGGVRGGGDRGSAVHADPRSSM